jgi:hypothetical protein
MKKIFLIAVIIGSNFNFISAQTWQWASSAGGIKNELATRNCSDNSGNVYVSGDLYLNASSGTAESYFGNDTLFVNSENDFFLAKYDANGNELWAKNFGGNYNNPFDPKTENLYSICYDSNTNAIYITGNYISSCTFDSFLLTTSVGDAQIFIAKFDLNGNCVWAKSAGSSGGDGGSAITIDPNGYVYVSGGLSALAAFDSFTVGAGAFLAKYDNSGNCVWVKNISNTFGGIGNNTAAIWSMKFYDSDLFLYANMNNDTVMFDTIQIVVNPGSFGRFIARFDSSENGHVRWTKVFATPGADVESEIDIDNSGSLYVSGVYYGGTAIFDSDTLHSAGASDFFIAKFDENGNYQWARNGNASIDAKAYGLICDGDGNTYISGSFHGTADFGTFTQTSLTTEDMFIARYNTNGDCMGVRHTGQAGGYDVTTYSGSVFVAGYYFNTVNFDTHSVTSLGGDDVYVAKIDEFTGIGGEERITNNQLIIYANPTTGKCNVTIPDEFQHEKNLTLSIYDSKGKLIQQIPVQMNEGKIKLNLEAEAKGVYNVTLSNGKKSYNGKIVFE